MWVQKFVFVFQWGACMIKLMIAEDERLERKALAFLIDKYFKDEIIIVCEATNGLDAIEKAKQFKPDLIMMDISMPIMDGLEAAKLIQNDCKHAEFVILTAYSNFSYAKEAIKLGINDYLLKPVSNEEFQKAIGKCVEIIHEKQKKINELLQLKKQRLELLPLLEKDLILKTVYGTNHSEKDIQSYFETMNISGSEFLAVIFKNDVVLESQISALSFVKTKMNGVVDFVIASSYSNELIFILFDNQLSKKINKIINLITRLIGEVKHQYNLNATVHRSDIYHQLSDLHACYLSCKSCVTVHKKEATDVLIEKEQQIFEKIFKEDLEGAVESFEWLFKTIISQEDFQTSKKKIHHFLVVLNRKIINFWGAELPIFKMNNIELQYDQLTTNQALGGYVKHLISEIILYVTAYKKDKNVLVIEEAKSYIKSHYKENLTLDEVADYMGFSSYYLSKLFKKVEKTNFKDYVIQLKMNHAKEMLKQSDCSIKEIAYELGYSDPNYFSRAFKKAVGISASDFSKISFEQ